MHYDHIQYNCVYYAGMQCCMYRKSVDIDNVRDKKWQKYREVAEIYTVRCMSTMTGSTVTVLFTC